MTPYDYIENPIICLDFRRGFIIRSTVFETNEYATCYHCRDDVALNFEVAAFTLILLKITIEMGDMKGL